MSTCCQLVGDLHLGRGCLLSISTSGGAEASRPCGPQSSVYFSGASKTTSITAYASMSVHRGCPGRAGVTLMWIKKYDCIGDKIHYIFSGEGESFVSGEANAVASVNFVGAESSAISASAGSGPLSIYMNTSQTVGFGLRYSGGPFSFNTGSVKNMIDFGFGSGYLQSFSYECQSGQVPIASYTFVTPLAMRG